MQETTRRRGVGGAEGEAEPNRYGMLVRVPACAGGGSERLIRGGARAQRRGLPLRRTNNQAPQLLRLSGRYLVAETRAFLAVARVLISLPHEQFVTRTVSCNRFLNQRCHVGSSHSLSSRWHLPRCSAREP